MNTFFTRSSDEQVAILASSLGLTEEVKGYFHEHTHGHPPFSSSIEELMIGSDAMERKMGALTFTNTIRGLADKDANSDIDFARLEVTYVDTVERLTPHDCAIIKIADTEDPKAHAFFKISGHCTRDIYNHAGCAECEEYAARDMKRDFYDAEEESFTMTFRCEPVTPVEVTETFTRFVPAK